jgi:quercetin dioxygenase-like cupin family protein
MSTLYQPGGSVIGWGELELDKVTELISRKLIAGDRQMVSQVYLKRGALVPLHRHESEQMTYVLDGLLKVRVAGEEVIVRDGEVIRIPSGVPHQAEALADTFELDLFSPIRGDWVDPGKS